MFDVIVTNTAAC